MNYEKKESLEKISNLKKRISSSQNVVFFGGAGVSTESGIPDFRGEEEIYNTMKKNIENPLKLYYLMTTLFQIQAYFMNIIKKI